MMHKELALYSAVGLTIGIAAALLSGCGEAGAPGTTTVRLAVRGDSSSVAPSATDASGAALRVEAARANVRSIGFTLANGMRCSELDPAALGDARCDDDATDDVGDDNPSTGGSSTDDSDEVRLYGPFVVDLMTGAATPSLEGLHIPAQTYTRVDVRFDDADPRDGLVSDGDPLAEQTLLASGAMTHGGEDLRFELTLDFSEDARFEQASGPIAVSADAPSEVLLWLDVARWFQAVRIGECMSDGDLVVSNGTVIIDDRGDCSDVEGALKDAIKESGQADHHDD
jgi:hypothetical protein